MLAKRSRPEMDEFKKTKLAWITWGGVVRWKIQGGGVHEKIILKKKLIYFTFHKTVCQYKKHTAKTYFYPVNLIWIQYTYIIWSDFSAVPLYLTLVLRIRSHFYWIQIRRSGLEKSDPDPFKFWANKIVMPFSPWFKHLVTLKIKDNLFCQSFFIDNIT